MPPKPSQAGSAPELLVFCDTEFSDMFDPDAELISIALVTDDGRELYLENKSLKKSGCSTFVHDEVLPQLERTSDVCARYPEIGGRIAAFIAGLGRPVAIVYDAEQDWIKLNETFMRQDGSTIRPANLVRQLSIPHPDLAYTLPEKCSKAAAAFFAAIEDFYLTENLPRHHARNDARAMRAAWQELDQAGIAQDLFTNERASA